MGDVFYAQMFVFRWKYPFLNSEPERTLHDFTHLFWLGGGFNPFEKYYRVLRIKVPFNIFLYYNDDFVDVHPMVERIIPKLTPTKMMAFIMKNPVFPIIRITHFFVSISRVIIFTNQPFWVDSNSILTSTSCQSQRPCRSFPKKKNPPMKIHQPGKPGSPMFKAILLLVLGVPKLPKKNRTLGQGVPSGKRFHHSPARLNPLKPSPVSRRCCHTKSKSFTSTASITSERKRKCGGGCDVMWWLFKQKKDFQSDHTQEKTPKTNKKMSESGKFTWWLQVWNIYTIYICHIYRIVCVAIHVDRIFQSA